MPEPTPILPGIKPTLDAEREMVESVTIAMRNFTAQHGEAEAIAAVLMRADGSMRVTAWSPANKLTARFVASAAAACLLEYAMKDD